MYPQVVIINIIKITANTWILITVQVSDWLNEPDEEENEKDADNPT